MAGSAGHIRTRSVFAGTSYGDTPPDGSINAVNSYEQNGTTVIDSSRNLVNIGSGTFSGNVIVGNSANISMDASGNGQLEVLGSGYRGAIALDGNNMNIYHNSS